MFVAYCRLLLFGVIACCVSIVDVFLLFACGMLFVVVVILFVMCNVLRVVC